MAIRVTCPGCHSRFQVSDKFAGKEGPCPKCKQKIVVPDSDEQVDIQEPETYGPKGTTGKAVLKPIFRKETSLSPVQIVGILAVIAGIFIAALFVRFSIDDKTALPAWQLMVAGLILAPPVVFGGYTFLRNSELEAYRGQPLWIRIGVCSVVYALLWMALLLSKVAFSVDTHHIGSLLTGLGVMVGLGAAVGMYTFDLDYLFGILHYGMYMGSCILMRWIAGLGPLPDSGGSAAPDQVVQFAFCQALSLLAFV